MAECAGLICRKMDNFDMAIEFLEVSISLYPDAEAYLISMYGKASVSWRIFPITRRP
jgi:hypothetical protein